LVLESPYASDFVARQAHNQPCSAALVFFFILFFLLIGGAVDFFYFDAFSSTAFPMATLMAIRANSIATKDFQRRTRETKMDKAALLGQLPKSLGNPKAWVLIGSNGLFAYSRGEEQSDQTIKERCPARPRSS
jgi:hypothetical protein